MVALAGGEGAVDSSFEKIFQHPRNRTGWIRQSIRVAFIRFGAAYPDLVPSSFRRV